MLRILPAAWKLATLSEDDQPDFVGFTTERIWLMTALGWKHNLQAP
jgi:hypothetical protein